MLTKSIDLTERQKAMVIAIAKIIERESGFPATVREIANETDISSTSVVNYNLRQLSKKNVIIMRPYRTGVLLTHYGKSIAKACYYE